jgi:hypothetical protein
MENLTKSVLSNKQFVILHKKSGGISGTGSAMMQGLVFFAFVHSASTGLLHVVHVPSR